MKMFKSDNVSGVHPKIMDAVVAANVGHENPYGNDTYSKKATESIRGLFGKDVDVYFALLGTATNVIGLGGLLRTFEAVICTETAHINTDECGSFEKLTGSKILTTPEHNGKIKIDDIKKYLVNVDNEHLVQPRVISISQTTETGTLYTVEEIKELADFAHKNDMYLHLDGARLANAVIALNSTFKEMVTDTGVDLLSLGGTKNGMMSGEAIVSFDKELSKNFKYNRKQGMQLLSKMRFASCQFIPYIEDEIWKECASNANGMGDYLKKRLGECKEVNVKEGFQTNMIFANMSQKIMDNLQEKYGFNTIDEETRLVRLVTSFDTVKEDIDEFIEDIKGLE
ncbi:MAG: threonine aldolase family protein [Tissierella sp.]|uniref:threonine aldolase family protein n=1 Tax=Tissierella sp. TaxID=41274 RepID=UPI003F9CAEEA